MVDFSASRSNGDRARREDWARSGGGCDAGAGCSGGLGASRRRIDGRCPRTAFMRGFSNAYHTTGKRFPSSPSFRTRLNPKNPRTKAVRGHEARCQSRSGATPRSLPRRGIPLQRPPEVAGKPRHDAASDRAAFRATGPTPSGRAAERPRFPKAFAGAQRGDLGRPASV